MKGDKRLKSPPTASVTVRRRRVRAVPITAVVVVTLVASLAQAVDHAVMVTPSTTYGAWVVEQVDGFAATEPSLAIDSSGRVHAVWDYFGNPDFRLVYGVRDAVGWTIVKVWLGSYVTHSFTLDAQGMPHILAYLRDGAAPSNSRFLHYYQGAAGWTSEVVATGAGNGEFSSLVGDTTGRLHAIFRYAGGNALGYAYRDATGWHIETLYGDGLAVWTGLDVDSQGRAHVTDALPWATQGTLRYSVRSTSGTWTSQILDANGGSQSSIAIGPNDEPHIAYLGQGEVLKYTTLSSGAWQSSIVDSAGPTGFETSIDVDASGRPHIAYWQLFNRGNPSDPLRGHIKYATTDADGPWTSEFINLLNIGLDPRLALDANGLPHVLFIDLASQVPWEPNFVLMHAEPAVAPALRALP